MRYSLFHGFLVFTLINIVSRVNTTHKLFLPLNECLSKEILSYCECDNSLPAIKCFGFKSFNLSSMFSAMNKSLKPDHKLFKEFWLKNHGITELEDNVFNGIRFKNIKIDEFD